MGLANWIHWSAWFMKNLLFLLISVVLITIVVKVNFSGSYDEQSVFFHYLH